MNISPKASIGADVKPETKAKASRPFAPVPKPVAKPIKAAVPKSQPAKDGLGEYAKSLKSRFIGG